MIDCDEITRLELDKDTERFWRDYRRNPQNEKQLLRDKYIPNILPREMACVKRPTDEQVKACQKLVFLVGHSIEPLLQSVCAYRPEEVLLVVNRRYGAQTTGEIQADMVKDLIAELHKAACPEVRQPEVEHCLSEGDDPAAVYRTLQQNLTETDSVVVDITGAKKSMVVGAFLFAALAGVPISYVNFPDDAYSQGNRRPYGYKAEIGPLSNPFEDFALQDWERVRAWYASYKFRDARLLLAGELEKGKYTGGTSTILTTMQKYVPESENAIRQLADVLYCYELWDNGDYNEAAEQAQKIQGFRPPEAVSTLEGKWYIVEEGKFGGGLPNFYEDTPEFRAYVFDELARIDRLRQYNRDYRSVLLRAGSLNEVVMLARLVKCMPDGEEKLEWLQELQRQTPNAYEVFDFLKRFPNRPYKLRQYVWRLPKTREHSCPNCGQVSQVECEQDKYGLPDVEIIFY